MMKPYPLVDDLLRPLLGVAMPRAVGSPAKLRRYIPHGGEEELFLCLHRFKQLEPERCPVPIFLF